MSQARSYCYKMHAKTPINSKGTRKQLCTWCSISFSVDISQSLVLWSDVSKNTSFNKIAWRFSLAVRLTRVWASRMCQEKAFVESSVEHQLMLVKLRCHLRFFNTFPLHRITLVRDFKSNWISVSVTSFTSFLDLEVFNFTWS